MHSLIRFRLLQTCFELFHASVSASHHIAFEALSSVYEVIVDFTTTDVKNKNEWYSNLMQWKVKCSLLISVWIEAYMRENREDGNAGWEHEQWDKQPEKTYMVLYQQEFSSVLCIGWKNVWNCAWSNHTQLFNTFCVHRNKILCSLPMTVIAPQWQNAAFPLSTVSYSWNPTSDQLCRSIKLALSNISNWKLALLSTMCKKETPTSLLIWSSRLGKHFVEVAHCVVIQQ